MPNALCLCDGLRDVGNLIVDGAVGIDGESRVINNTQVSGSWVNAGAMTVTGNVEIAKDLSVGGDLSGVGRLEVKGALRVAGSRPRRRRMTTPRSGCPKSLAAIGVAVLELPTGSYYFNDLRTIGLTRIKVTGAVALHFDGDYLSIGADLIDIAPGASLDLYVSGVVRTVGYVRAGGEVSSLGIPSLCRLIRSLEPVPTASIAYVGHTVVRGGLFAKEVTGIGNLEIRGARPVPPDPTVCGQPDPTPPSQTPVDTPVIM